MLKVFLISGAAALSLAACGVAPPASPMERHARMAAAAEIAARQCAGFAGGYSGARELREDANRNIVAARNLGADDAVVEKAREDARIAYESAVIWIGRPDACNHLISELAWQVG